MSKEKGFMVEFKKFISRGSVVDMAVGIVVGSAFTAIVNSLVKDIIMPFVGLITGGINFADLKWVISPATETAAEVALTYGNFIQAIINFLLLSFVIFTIVRTMNKVKEKAEAAKKAEEAAKKAAEEAKKPAPAPVVDEKLQTLKAIEALLKAQSK